MEGRRPSPKVGSSVQSSKGFTTEPNAGLTAALRPLMEQMTLLNTKMDIIQSELKESGLKFDKLQQDFLETKKVVDKNDSKLQKMEKEKALQGDNVLRLQMDRANFFLRFQNVPEQKEENLKQLMSEALAPVIGWEAEKIQSDMDVSYKTYPEFVKKNNLPGEIVIRFTKRSRRDVVLKATNRTTLKIQEEEIKVLKDIPFEIRKRRKAYRSLTTWLKLESIIYRWNFPEGLSFSFKSKKYIIDSVEKAKNFLEKNKEKKKGTKSDDSLEAQESMYGFDNSESEEGEEQSDSEKGAAAPKPQQESKKKKRGPKKK